MIPIGILAILTPVGLILPISTGEQMGFQITVFLTLIVYIEGISQKIPVTKEMNGAPRLLHFFIVAILVSGISMCVSTITLVLTHASAGLEMSKWQAQFCIIVSNVFHRLPVKAVFY